MDKQSFLQVDNIRKLPANIQKQPLAVFSQNTFSFHKIHSAPVPGSLFNKVTGFQPATLLKKSLRERCFPNFVKFLRTPFS